MKKHWSRHHKACIRCHRTSIRHKAKGYCLSCYKRWRSQCGLTIIKPDGTVKHWKGATKMTFVTFNADGTILGGSKIDYSLPPNKDGGYHFLLDEDDFFELVQPQPGSDGPGWL